MEIENKKRKVKILLPERRGYDMADAMIIKPRLWLTRKLEDKGLRHLGNGCFYKKRHDLND